MKIYTVTEFRQELNELLGQVTVAVQGEVSGLHTAQNRFVWFSLVDDETAVQCFMLAFQLQVPLKDGMEIRAVGSPTVFKKGQLVFKPRQIELIGDGALQQAFEILKATLSKEGLFDESRKRSLPRFPQRIGLVTSVDAAAYTDVLRILKNRWSGLEIVHLPVNVQGVQAVSSIVGALQQLNDVHPDLDCLILTRGGGSLEDLQAFNSEEVVRAIFSSRIPVVSGVGHERDVTLADFVADVRASTPSNAAERVAPDKQDVIQEIAYLLQQCEHRVERTIQQHADHLRYSIETLDMHTRTQINAFHSLEYRLGLSLQQALSVIQTQQQRIAHAVDLLRACHPAHVLKRGYSITTDVSGKALHSVRHLQSGDQMMTRFADGSATSIVQSAAATAVDNATRKKID